MSQHAFWLYFNNKQEQQSSSEIFNEKTKKPCGRSWNNNCDLLKPSSPWVDWLIDRLVKIVNGNIFCISVPYFKCSKFASTWFSIPQLKAQKIQGKERKKNQHSKGLSLHMHQQAVPRPPARHQPPTQSHATRPHRIHNFPPHQFIHQIRRQHQIPSHGRARKSLMQQAHHCDVTQVRQRRRSKVHQRSDQWCSVVQEESPIQEATTAQQI